MPEKKISQRDARRYMRRVAFLERVLDSERRRWSNEYLGGADIGSIEGLTEADEDTNAATATAIRTARMLGHAVVVAVDKKGPILRVVALPHPDSEVL